MSSPKSVKQKFRLNQSDAHYGGNLVDGARVMALFGDLATELLIRLDGDEGLFRAYESVDFLAPLYAGDIIEGEATLIKKGQTSRKIGFKVYKLIESLRDCEHPTKAKVLKKKLLVAQATGTCVIPK